MLLGKVPHHDITLGSYQRSDGQQFKLSARLFELPAEYEYWQATYDGEHDQWGHMRFVLTVRRSHQAWIALAPSCRAPLSTK